MPVLADPVPSQDLRPGDRLVDTPGPWTVEADPVVDHEEKAVTIRLEGNPEPVPFAYDWGWQVDRPATDRT